MKPIARAVGWVAAFVGVGLAITVLLSLGLPDTFSQWWLARIGAIQTVGFGAATWIVGRRLNRRSWAELGWTGPRGFARGALWGAAMALLAVGLAVLLSGAHVRIWIAGITPVVEGAPILVGVLLAALSEELMFRGYLTRSLADALGRGRAVAVSSALFGIAHIWNPGSSIVAAVNIALAGVWLAFAFFSPGGMPLAWGVHVGWNAALAELFHAPVSGFAFAVPGGMYTPGRYTWLDGGSVGPEGGLVGTVALAAGAFVFWRGFRAPRLAETEPAA